MSITDTPHREILLDRVEVYARKLIAREELDEFAGPDAVEVMVRSVTPGIVDLICLRKFAAQKFDDITVRYPADWWQAFKERWAPAWVRDRWPVRDVVRVIKIYDAYPSIQIPPNHKPIRLAFDGAEYAALNRERTPAHALDLAKALEGVLGLVVLEDVYHVPRQLAGEIVSNARRVLMGAASRR